MNENSNSGPEPAGEASIAPLWLAKAPFTWRSVLLALFIAVLSGVAVPVLVLFHSMWQVGLAVALFPLSMACIALVGALVFGFVSLYRYDVRQARNTVPIMFVVSGVMVGVYVVQVSSSMRMVAKMTGTLGWADQSLTQLGGIVKKSRDVMNDAQAIVGGAKTIVVDSRGVVTEARGLISDATGSLRGVSEFALEAEKIYALLKLWFGAAAAEKASAQPIQAAVDISPSLPPAARGDISAPAPGQFATVEGSATSTSPLTTTVERNAAETASSKKQSDQGYWARALAWIQGTWSSWFGKSS